MTAQCADNFTVLANMTFAEWAPVEQLSGARITASLARTVMMDQTSHDNPPPRREWQGLTDEEIVKFADEVSGEEHSVEDFARAIEAVLRSKNK